jgi:hypothetical protein
MTKQRKSERRCLAAGKIIEYLMFLNKSFSKKKKDRHLEGIHLFTF